MTLRPFNPFAAPPDALDDQGEHAWEGDDDSLAEDSEPEELPTNQGPQAESPEAHALRLETCALGLLGRRDHSVAELRRKLARRAFDPMATAALVDRFLDIGYLDDARFARLFGQSLVRKRYGPRQIAGRLRQRGLEARLVQETLRSLDTEVDWAHVCGEQLRGRFRSPERAQDPKQRDRIVRHLLQRGFAMEFIRQALHAWLANEDGLT